MQITITLNKIREHSPCASGWEKLLASKGKTKADDEEFPLLDVLESNGLDDALWCLRCLPEHQNLWRKYAVWCANQVRHLMKDERSTNAIEVAWKHANGEATDEELAAAWDAARDAAGAAAGDAAGAAARAASRAASRAAARDAARAASRAAAWDAARDAAGAAAWAAAGAAARAAQKESFIAMLETGDIEKPEGI
jgi:hypothetical protein